MKHHNGELLTDYPSTIRTSFIFFLSFQRVKVRKPYMSMCATIGVLLYFRLLITLKY